MPRNLYGSYGHSNSKGFVLSCLLELIYYAFDFVWFKSGSEITLNESIIEIATDTYKAESSGDNLGSPWNTKIVGHETCVNDSTQYNWDPSPDHWTKIEKCLVSGSYNANYVSLFVMELTCEW